MRPPLALAPAVSEAFLAGATRRLLVHRVELRLRWGLGQAVGLFQAEEDAKLRRLEGALARLRRRFPEAEVRPGWMAPDGSRDLAAERETAYRATARRTPP